MSKYAEPRVLHWYLTREPSLAQPFWRAFWLGVFERNGRSVVYRLDMATPGNRPRPIFRREMQVAFNVLGAMPLHLPMPESVQQMYDMLSKAHYASLHPVVRHELEQGIALSEFEWKKWLNSENDEVGMKIRQVLQRAAALKSTNRNLSNRDLARKLTRKEPYREETIRKILDGSYPAQNTRRIPGLVESWRESF